MLSVRHDGASIPEVVGMYLGKGFKNFMRGFSIPEITFANLHPKGDAIWPLMFVTIACGAISGFHATQSPMMARCVTSEKQGRTVFYGAMIADFLNFKQGPIKNRLTLTAPLFIIAFILTKIDFNIIWRYFAWSNQTLAMVVLWAAAMYLVVKKQFHWIATVPATFMTAVSVTYILVAPEGFQLAGVIAYPIGILAAVGSLAWFLSAANKKTQISTSNRQIKM